MAVSLSIGSHAFTVSNSRMERLVAQDENQATHLSLWDKIKDCFRSEKKKDVINELYRLMHQGEQPSKFGERVEAFQRIKTMANPVSQDSFRIENHPDSEDITFTVGNTVIYRQTHDILSVEDKAYLDRYYLDRANVDTTLRARFLEPVQKYLDGSLRVQGEGTAQLFKDITRGSYEFDGVKLSINDGVKPEEKVNHLNKFLEKLTDAQKKALNVVGSQLGPIALIDALLALPDSPLVFLGNPDKEAKYHLDEGGKMLTVHIKVWQHLDNEAFNTLRDAYNKQNAHWCGGGLSLNATFTIPEHGTVDCTDFKFSSLSEDSPPQNHAENSALINMEKTSLLTAKPSQGQLLTWLQQFIHVTEGQWHKAINENPTLKTQQDRIQKAGDQQAFRDFSLQKLTTLISGYSAAEKQQMLTYMEGQFGQRLRAVSDLAFSRVSKNLDPDVDKDGNANEDAKIISMASRYTNALEVLIKALRNQLGKRDRPITPAKDLQELKASEILALSQVGITAEMLA